LQTRQTKMLWNQRASASGNFTMSINPIGLSA
jgi:hypothetical protein